MTVKQAMDPEVVRDVASELRRDGEVLEAGWAGEGKIDGPYTSSSASHAGAENFRK